MAGIKSIDDLFLHTLKDVYYAERQILKALPKMAKAAQNEQLRDAFMHHREQTQTQIERLQQVFEALGKRAQGITCEALNGLVEECEELLDEAKEPSPVRDAGLIAGAQAIEHYEMARYGALVAWAKAIGKKDIVQLLEETLNEEKQTDTLLNDMANKQINPAAAKAA
ncbi:ferritin-like domain-containing protein [Roseomonas sp. M0104]|uniref:Ferritin-like domain-containing protein n=1 Tax=Teichococcus coralli TaxID=2545983 RepID=A0A845B7L6_9PROT|nr:ferritin-like domain-containing protein [Pseudoroseomonas coralli]MXP62488.1 ferritin-like domain-containing protein [Pseudoroseomonas coralli]